jgi:hypothetical protein
LHAAEHSASIECVMANGGANLSMRDHIVGPAQNELLRETFPHDLRARPSVAAALFRPDDCDSETVARTVDSQGVSDPVRAAAG